MNCSSCVNTTALGVVCTKCNYGWWMNSSGYCDVTCASNQYSNSGNSSCVNCSTSCSTCTSATNTSCTSCSLGKYLLTNATGGYCLVNCPAVGYYSDSTQCTVCYSSCYTCNGGLINSNHLYLFRLSHMSIQYISI
jgi:proprotein convertase subtilisin/kexin type 5